jgi:hypothetical protein
MKRFFSFVSDKIKAGSPVTNTYSYAVTDAGSRMLCKSGFAEVKNMWHPELKTTVRFMRYEHQAGS